MVDSVLPAVLLRASSSHHTYMCRHGEAAHLLCLSANSSSCMLTLSMPVLSVATAVQDEIFLNGAVVLPHKEIKESVVEPRIIL
jgi:hypothetical protein